MKNALVTIAALFALLLLSATATAQTAPTKPKADTTKTAVKYDAAKGEYYHASKDTAERDPLEGCEKSAARYRDSKGQTWPVYKSKTGKIFAYVTSQKTGNQYRKYLDVQ